MKFYVLSNLEHDGTSYPKGSTIELDESSDVAIRLVGAQVISTIPNREEVAAAAPAQEEQHSPEVGGQTMDTGEPSLDGQQDASSSGDAQDVTPVVSEKMTRAELEEAAKATGITDADIEAAPNKGALVD